MPIDVRVRLSKEGEEAVVAAFQKIQAEAVKTAKVSNTSFSSLSGGLGNLNGILAKIGIGLSVATFTNFIRQATEAADGLRKFQQQTGASAENLSALALQVKLSDLDLADISRSLAQFAVRSGEAARGSGDMVEVFRKIGLSKKEIESFKGKDTIERLEIVAKRFNALKDGPEKTALALAAFGRSAQALVPLLNQLGEQGLEKLKEKADSLGVLIDQDTLDRVDALSASFKELSAAVQGVGIRTAGGLAAELKPALDTLALEIGAQRDSWKDLGQFIGVILRFVIGLFTGLVDTFVTGFEIIRNAAVSTAFAIKAALKGDFEQAKIELANGEKLNQRLKENYSRRITDIAIRTVKPPTDEPTKQRTGTAPGDDRTLQDRAAAAKVVADAELRLEQARLKLREDQEARSYQQSLISVQEYYDSRRKIVEAGIDAEISVQEKRRKVELKNQDPLKQAANLKAIDSEIERLGVERQNRLEDLTGQQIEAVRQLQQQRLEFEAKILEAQGRTHDARMLQINQEVEKQGEMLAKLGVPPEQAQAELDQFRAAQNNAIAFDETSQQINTAMLDFGRRRDRIQNRATAGLLSQAQAESGILGLEKSRIDTLRALAANLVDIAQKSGNLEQIQKADSVAASVEQLGIHIEASGQDLARFGATAVDVFGGNLVDAMGRAGQSVETFGQLLLGVIRDSLAALERFAAQLLYTKLISAIFPGVPAPGIPAGSFEADIPRAAEGGLVSAPGTGTSDSGLARVSDGEYIVPARVVSQPGVLNNLEIMRLASMSPGAPRFADGGLVGGTSDLRPAGAELSGFIGVGPAPGWEAHLLHSPGFQRGLLKLVKENPRAYEAALRGRR